MHIYERTGSSRRKSGRNIVCRVITSSGKYRYQSFKEKKPAKRWGMIQEGHLAAGVEPDPRQDSDNGSGPRHHLVRDMPLNQVLALPPEQHTVAAALSLYRSVAPNNLEENTWRDQQKPIVKRWERHPYADRLITDLYYDEIQSWIRESIDDGAASSTIRGRLNVLLWAINLAMNRWRYQHVNPCANHQIKKVRAKINRRPTTDEKAALYEAAASMDSTFIYWAMCWAEACGMRRSEIARMRADDLDLNHRPLPLVTVPRTKTTPRSYYAWDSLIELYHAIRAAIGDGPYLFGGIRPDAITKAFSKVRARAGVSSEVEFRSFRRDANSWMAESPEVTRTMQQQIMGHVTDEMSDYYTDHSEKMVHALERAYRKR